MIFILIPLLYLLIGSLTERRRLAVLRASDTNSDRIKALRTSMDAISHQRMCNVSIYGSHRKCDCLNETRYNSLKLAIANIQTESPTYWRVPIWPFLLYHKWMSSGSIKSLPANLDKEIDIAEKQLGIGQ